MLQNFIIFNPIFSAILSILFFNGLYSISKRISNYEYFDFLNVYFTNINFLIFLLLTNFLAFSLYLFFLFLNINLLLIKSIAILIILMGVLDLFKLNIKKIKIHHNFFSYLFFLIIILYFFLSLSPITDPDSLEYHIGVPLYSLKHGVFFVKDYWLHSQLAGAGEALNTLGLSIHAIQIPTFIQFLSLLLIIATIHFSKSKFFLNISLKNKYFIYLIIISCPVFLFLGNTAKPQLFAIATSFIAFFLCFIILPREKKNENKKKLYFLIVILTLFTTQIKYSFFLSCGIILIFSFYEMYKARLFFYAISISIILFTLIVVPREIYDYLFVNKNILVNFFYPIADPYLYENIKSSLRHGVGLSRNFPYWLIVPAKLGEITYTLGLGILIIFFNFSLKLVENKKIFYASIIYFLVGLYFGQPSGRFFVEPFLWIILLASINFKFYKRFFYKFFYFTIILQSSLILLTLVFATYNFFPGILNKENYLKVLSKFADGYSIYNWSNKNLSDNSVLLTTHRSISLSKVDTIFTEFRAYYSHDEDDKFIVDYYIQRIKKQKPTHILYVEHEHGNHLDVFKNCRGKIFKSAKNVGKFAVRNVFNKNLNKYDGYIYNISNEDLNKC